MQGPEHPRDKVEKRWSRTPTTWTPRSWSPWQFPSFFSLAFPSRAPPPPCPTQPLPKLGNAPSLLPRPACSDAWLCPEFLCSDRVNDATYEIVGAHAGKRDSYSKMKRKVTRLFFVVSINRLFKWLLRALCLKHYARFFGDQNKTSSAFRELLTLQETEQEYK